jgi:hypothetical protein
MPGSATWRLGRLVQRRRLTAKLTATVATLGDQLDPDSDSLMGVGGVTAGTGTGSMGRTVP